MNPLLMQILVIALPILLPPFVAFVFLQAKRAIANLPANQRDFVSNIVSDMVISVEQSEKNSGMSGSDKKALAFRMITDELSHWGITVPAGIISALIESAVSAAEIIVQKPAALVPVVTKQGSGE